MSISTIRHDSIFNKELALPVTIIGAGATGSRVFASLIELGVRKITLVDYDRVEPHNLANQIFGVEHIGAYKTRACVDWAKWKAGVHAVEHIQCIEGRAPEDVAQANGIVFLLTDTMASRREIATWLMTQFTCLKFIETRMASSFGDCYVVDPLNVQAMEKWFTTLTSDEDAEVSPCGGSISVGPTASVLANLAVWQYIHLCMATGDWAENHLFHHVKFHLAPWTTVRHDIIKNQEAA